jgi:hypothetical protein
MAKRAKQHKKNARRYRPGRRTLKFEAHDAGIIFKGRTGQVKFVSCGIKEEHQPNGGPTFWLNFLRWLFESGAEADERRNTFIEEFMADMEDRQLRREAERRVDADPVFEGLDDEQREAQIQNAMDAIREESNEASA